MGIGLGRTKSTSDLQPHVGRQLLDHVPLKNSSGTDVAESDSGSREVGFAPKTGVFQLIPSQIRKQSLVERCENLQKRRRAVESEVQKNGGTCQQVFLFWK